jgi:hypothetical protein
MDDDLLLASLLGRAPAAGAPSLSIEIAPPAAAGYAEADYAIALRNDGAAPVALLLSADDRGRLLSYELGVERLALAPGQTAHVPLTVEAPRRLLGPDVPIAFTVYAEPFGPVPPLGQREHRPTQSEELRLVARAGGKETVAILRVVVEP